jgi:integrase/recombinase XerC
MTPDLDAPLPALSSSMMNVGGRRKDLFLAPSLLPLQFPSLEHMDERVARALHRIATVEKLSDRTQAWLRESYRVFRRFLAQDTPRALQFVGGDLRRQMLVLDAWIAAMHQADLARSTVNNYWRAVRMLWVRVAREDGVVNPFLFLETPHPGSTEPKFLTQEAAEAVVLFVRNDARVSPRLRARNGALFAVMLLAGLRRAEVLNLNVKDVDFDSHVLRIRHGKGRHGGKPRTVPMTSQLEGICHEYVELVRQPAQTASPRFFLGTRLRTGLAESTLVRLFRRVSRRSGVHVTPHMLRHTFCTLLSKGGIADRLAREAMGHADFKTLQRYQHVYEGEVAAEMDAKLRLNID